MTTEHAISDQQLADNVREAGSLLGAVWARELKAAWKRATSVRVISAALKEAQNDRHQ